MDNKQIIIDGVDVSGCDYFKNSGKCRIPHYQQNVKYTCCNCSEWNCCYKQLKRAEQKLDKIKKVCNKFIPDHYKILLIINNGIVEE